MELRVEHGLDAVVTKQHCPRQRDFRWSGWLGSAERLCKVRAWRNRFAPTTGPGPARYVLGMAVTYVFAGIPVAHRDAAAGWYERLIGRPPDLIPNDDEAAWRLTETGWIYMSPTQTAPGRRCTRSLSMTSTRSWPASLSEALRPVQSQPLAVPCVARRSPTRTVITFRWVNHPPEGSTLATSC